MSHIIGKVYDVTAENMNKLIKEIEFLQQENASLQQMPSGIALQALSKMNQSETKTMPEAVEYFLLQDAKNKNITLGYSDEKRLDDYYEKFYHSNKEARNKIHVISYDAYSALKAECERLSKENERLFKANLEAAIEHPTYQLSKQLESENAALVAENEKLRNDLNFALLAQPGDGKFPEGKDLNEWFKMRVNYGIELFIMKEIEFLQQENAALQSGFEFEIDKRNLENAELRAALEEVLSKYSKMT
jgi:hypothetical protein